MLSCKVLFVEIMYVNIFFVMSCQYSAVSLIAVREQRFIRMIYDDYDYDDDDDDDGGTEQRIASFICKGEPSGFVVDTSP